jgi:ATP-dependent Zn protease
MLVMIEDPEQTAHDIAQEFTPPMPPTDPEFELDTEKVAPEDLAAQRTKLFTEGSDFKPTDRTQIIGIDDVLDEIDEIIHWLANSDQYMIHKARIEPGIILAGSPGTGKTSTARYIATKSNAFFVNVRDFAHQGNLFSDSDIRDLFQRAREKYAATRIPLVLFWDEFEGVAKERSGDHTSPDQAAVVSQLTSELEGALGKNEGILLVGCTNYLYDIDHALRRSGRLGLHFEFTAPDRKGKEKILAFYLGQKHSRDGIDVETLSHFFDKEATAADIEEACEEAWRNATRRHIDDDKSSQPTLSQEDLVKVFVKRLVGPPTTYKVPEHERIRIAIHEIGHAVVAMAYGVKVRLITVQPGKKSLGRTMIDELMEYIASKDEIVNWIRCGAGGIAAERAAGIPELIGCTGDIVQINQNVQRLIDKMGYGETTGLYNPGEYSRDNVRGYSTISPTISEEMVKRSDHECKKLVDRIERDANTVMEVVGSDDLWTMALALNECVTMTGTEFLDLFEKITGKQPEWLVPGATSELVAA